MEITINKQAEFSAHFDKCNLSSSNTRVIKPEFRTYTSLASTMDEARNLIQSGLATPFVVQADKQTAGRGRQGRSWLGTHKGLYTTIVCETNLPVASLSGLSLMVGVSLIRTLTPYTRDIGLKWPNDLLCTTGEKLGGVLIETNKQQQFNYILLGIGINLSGKMPSELKASNLANLGVEIEPVHLLVELYNNFFEAWQVFQKSGFSAFKTEWLASYLQLGKVVQFNLSHAKENGLAVDVDDTGALIVQDSNGVKRQVSAGEVSAI